jgi:hypothetical protein
LRHISTFISQFKFVLNKLVILFFWFIKTGTYFSILCGIWGKIISNFGSEIVGNLLGKYTIEWEDDIKMYVTEITSEDRN